MRLDITASVDGNNWMAAGSRMAPRRDDSTTTEMRHDWLADRWVIMAPQRTERPDDFVRRPSEVQDATSCPFCSGRERETPSAVAVYTPPKNGSIPHWHVRVIPNKFPAVNRADPTMRLAASMGETGDQAERESLVSERIDLFQRRNLTGGHEVIVESPLHLQSLSELDRETAGLVFQAYRDRLRYWLQEQQCAYAVVFKNVGQDAGASLAHTHSQVIATDIVPTDIGRATDRMKSFAAQEGTCLFCQMAEDELEQGIRVVEQTPDFVAFCPFASRLPSLVTILPKAHQSHFERLSDAETEQLSWLTHRLVRRIERCYPDAAYNFVIHTAPSSMRDSHAFHWRLELFPRLTKVAGFEWGSDCYINPLPPENAAKNLRVAGV